MGRSYFVRKTLYSRGFSPRKTDDKFLEKDDIKTEDKESEVKYLPLPDPMPLDAAGNRIDSRIPEHLKPPEKLSSLDFLVITIFILTCIQPKSFLWTESGIRTICADTVERALVPLVGRSPTMATSGRYEWKSLCSKHQHFEKYLSAPLRIQIS